MTRADYEERRKRMAEVRPRRRLPPPRIRAEPRQPVSHPAGAGGGEVARRRGPRRGDDPHEVQEAV